MNFYKCPICGNIITIHEGDINHVRCCNVELEQLIPNTVDALVEKHVPVYSIEGDTINVTIGEVEHPMLDEHYISFIAYVKDKNVTIAKLNPNEKPSASFKYERNSEIYEYCNLHGLWKRDVE